MRFQTLLLLFLVGHDFNSSLAKRKNREVDGRNPANAFRSLLDAKEPAAQVPEIEVSDVNHGNIVYSLPKYGHYGLNADGSHQSSKSNRIGGGSAMPTAAQETAYQRGRYADREKPRGKISGNLADYHDGRPNTAEGRRLVDFQMQRSDPNYLLTPVTYASRVASVYDGARGSYYDANYPYDLSIPKVSGVHGIPNYYGNVQSYGVYPQGRTSDAYLNHGDIHLNDAAILIPSQYQNIAEPGGSEISFGNSIKTQDHGGNQGAYAQGQNLESTDLTPGNSRSLFPRSIFQVMPERNMGGLRHPLALGGQPASNAALNMGDIFNYGGIGSGQRGGSKCLTPTLATLSPSSEVQSLGGGKWWFFPPDPSTSRSYGLSTEYPGKSGQATAGYSNFIYPFDGLAGSSSGSHSLSRFLQPMNTHPSMKINHVGYQYLPVSYPIVQK